MTSLNDTKILVIEDEPDLRAGLQHNLELEGYQVETAADGREGLRKARDDRPTLILLDLMLPGLSGLDVLRQLRETGREMPVIIVSANGQDRDKVPGRRARAGTICARWSWTSRPSRSKVRTQRVAASRER